MVPYYIGKFSSSSNLASFSGIFIPLNAILPDTITSLISVPIGTLLTDLKLDEEVRQTEFSSRPYNKKALQIKFCNASIF
jgi:hypothetical protein